MNREDLMINDWVNFNGTIDKVQEILYVDKPKHLGYCASFAASATLIPIQLDKIKPIKLTSDILEKNFDVKTDYMGNKFFIDEKQKFFVRFNQIYMESDAYNNGILIGYCDYVHELQHFMKSIKIEKIIDL